MEALDGEWMLMSVLETTELACMEFDQGVLIFHNAICWVDSFGFMPNDLDRAAVALSDGHSFVLSFSYTILSTYDVIIVGEFVDQDYVNVFFTALERGPNGDEWSFPAVLVRQHF